MLIRPPALAVLCAVLLCPSARAEEVKYQVTGLFAPERDPDLREVVAQIPEVKLAAIDFKNAEATFTFDPAKAFPGAKPDQVLQRLDNLVKTASRGTFGLKPLRSIPLEKLKLVEIGAAGLDCKGCALAAYEAIYKLEGVERATASFREGRITALIDPVKTDKAKLEAALKARGVSITNP